MLAVPKGGKKKIVRGENLCAHACAQNELAKNGEKLVERNWRKEEEDSFWNVPLKRPIGSSLV
jgi:hypothetical protein